MTGTRERRRKGRKREKEGVKKQACGKKQQRGKRSLSLKMETGKKKKQSAVNKTKRREKHYSVFKTFKKADRESNILPLNTFAVYFGLFFSVSMIIT